VCPFLEEMQKLGADATRRPRARGISGVGQGRGREYAMGPGRHIYPRAGVAQFRGVDTRHSCNAECDAPPFGCWVVVDSTTNQLSRMDFEQTGWTPL
jgi:hypothetical protein